MPILGMRTNFFADAPVNMKNYQSKDGSAQEDHLKPRGEKMLSRLQGMLDVPGEVQSFVRIPER
jgi:hypothetical protein